MRKLIVIFLLLSFISCFGQNKTSTDFKRDIPFDNNWLFLKDSLSSAESPNYDDSKWQKVELPHDWSIYDLPNPIPDSISGPFFKGSIGNFATGFTVGGTGWYRKKFITENSMKNQIITIQFDGVYMNADVWINGQHLGNHPYGYTPFYFDITNFLKPAGQQNVFSVRVRNEGKNSRWYSGSGIYRHVWLTETNPIHIAQWGTYITTPNVSDKKATIKIKYLINNERSFNGNIQVTTSIISPEGKTVTQGKHILALNGDDSISDTETFSLLKPELWSLETPRLYKAISIVREGNKLIDRAETSFGIRSIHIDAENGFVLNGKNIKLHGGCIHHDNGPLGAASIDRAVERKIEILKANGFNAIRLSHNPQSKELYDACDKLGMLIIDEAFDAWQQPKNPDDYHVYFNEWWKKDLDAMILRDRNHPSVVIWSIGNEIPERVTSEGLNTEKELVDEVHQLDPTRPVTEAFPFFFEEMNKGKTWESTIPPFAMLGVGGYNYQWRQYEPDHVKFPERIMMGTESVAKEALENWSMVEKHPYVIGDFVWTAVDYMGEASIGYSALNDGTKKFGFSIGWPYYDSWCGDIDIIGNKKPQSYYRDVVWRRKPIAMAVHAPIPEGSKEIVSYWGWPDEWPHWTWQGAENKPLQVHVYSHAPLVRLYLNGKQIGEQKIKDSSITATFEVTYHKGVLKAVNVINGKETDALEYKTAGNPTHLNLTADHSIIKAGRNDLSYVTVQVVDDNNNIVPTADIPVSFSISGEGEISAIGNANPTDLSGFHNKTKHTFHGTCLAIVRPTRKKGIITLKASANGLKSSQIVIKTN
jgi:Beta-galactosidase/beta-glucuronidase